MLSVRWLRSYQPWVVDGDCHWARSACSHCQHGTLFGLLRIHICHYLTGLTDCDKHHIWPVGLESRNHIFGWRVLHCGIVDPVFIVVKKRLSPLTTACYTMNAQHCHCYTRIANCYNHCSNQLQSQPQCVFCVWFCGSGCANLSQLQPQWSYMMSMITTSGIAAANHCSCCSNHCSNNCTMYSPR